MKFDFKMTSKNRTLEGKIRTLGGLGVKDYQKNRTSLFMYVTMCKSILISNCRYDCEGRSAGAMQGVSSTSEFRTFPKIQIKGYQVIKFIFHIHQQSD